MNSSEETKIIVTDIQMPFVSMVIFMVKWALAPKQPNFLPFVISGQPTFLNFKIDMLF